MRDLHEVFWNCIGLMDEIGMDYGNITDINVNTRAKRRWGQCHATFVGWSSDGEAKYNYSINISEILLDDRVPIESLQNTIIHEILHTCPGCYNHGAEWKRRAAKVKRELGYDIKRCTDADEKGISDSVKDTYEKPRYIVRCKNCGREVKHYRMCDIVKRPYMWRCGKCDGTFERIA